LAAKFANAPTLIANTTICHAQQRGDIYKSSIIIRPIMS
jgi:hypothetical protein